MRKPIEKVIENILFCLRGGFSHSLFDILTNEKDRIHLIPDEIKEEIKKIPIKSAFEVDLLLSSYKNGIIFDFQLVKNRICETGSPIFIYTLLRNSEFTVEDFCNYVDYEKMYQIIKATGFPSYLVLFYESINQETRKNLDDYFKIRSIEDE